jgi:hypothetical protein
MMTNNFGPSSAPPSLPAMPTYAFLKTAAQAASAEISLQLRIVKGFSGESEESLFQIAKTLRNIINVCGFTSFLPPSPLLFSPFLPLYYILMLKRLYM